MIHTMGVSSLPLSGIADSAVLIACGTVSSARMVVGMSLLKTSRTAKINAGELVKTICIVIEKIFKMNLT